MSSVAANSGHGHSINRGSAARAALPSARPDPPFDARGSDSRALGVIAASVQWSLLATAVVAFVGFGVLPLLGAYRTLTVLSGSMKPTFGPGM